MQNCILLGRVAKENGISNYPTQDGKTGSAIRFSFAVRDQRGRKDKSEENTDFFNCVLFTLSDKVVSNIKVGVKLALYGRFKNETYQDKNTGETKYSTSFIVDDFEFCEKMQQAQGQPAGQMPMPQAGTPQMPIPTPQVQPQMTMPQMAAPVPNAMPQMGVPVQNAAPQMAAPTPAPVPNVAPQPMPQMGAPVAPQPVPMQNVPGFSTPAGMDFSGAIPDIGNLPFN